MCRHVAERHRVQRDPQQPHVRRLQVYCRGPRCDHTSGSPIPPAPCTPACRAAARADRLLVVARLVQDARDAKVGEHGARAAVGVADSPIRMLSPRSKWTTPWKWVARAPRGVDPPLLATAANLEPATPPPTITAADVHHLPTRGASGRRRIARRDRAFRRVRARGRVARAVAPCRACSPSRRRSRSRSTTMFSRARLSHPRLAEDVVELGARVATDVRAATQSKILIAARRWCRRLGHVQLRTSCGRGCRSCVLLDVLHPALLELGRHRRRSETSSVRYTCAAIDDCIFDDCPRTEARNSVPPPTTPPTARVSFLLPHIGGGGARTGRPVEASCCPTSAAARRRRRRGPLVPPHRRRRRRATSSASGIGASGGTRAVFSFLLSRILAPSIGRRRRRRRRRRPSPAPAPPYTARAMPPCAAPPAPPPTPDLSPRRRRGRVPPEPHAASMASGLDAMRLMSALSRRSWRTSEKPPPVHGGERPRGEGGGQHQWPRQPSSTRRDVHAVAGG